MPILRSVERAAAWAGWRYGMVIEVLALDDHRDPIVAARLIDHVGEDADVIGVVGPKNSGSAWAAMGPATSAALPLLLPAATADDLTGSGAALLRLCARDRATAAATIEV